MEKTSPQGKPEEKYCTYKVYDPDIQKIIYVGMTSDLQRRIKEHGHNSKWWKATLRFDAMDQELDRQQARDREKYWIRRYAEEGHPLKNDNSNPHMDTERFMILTWLGADTDNPTEEMEQVIQYFFRGREHLSQRDHEDMEWRFTESWDRIYFAIRSIAKELAAAQNINDLEIARLTAKAVGMDIESEAKE